MAMRFAIVFILCAVMVSACTKKTETVKTDGDPNSPEQMRALVEKGRMVYVANCTSCHGVDPKHEGAMGPAVHGSSLELLEKRVVDGTYPEKYKPKRSTKIMQALPFLKGDIKTLHAYLNQP